MDSTSLRLRRKCAFLERISGGNKLRRRCKKANRGKRRNLPILTNFNELETILDMSKEGTTLSRTNHVTSGNKTEGRTITRNEFITRQGMIERELNAKSSKTVIDIINYLISSHHDQEFIKKHNLNPVVMAATLSQKKTGLGSKTSTKTGGRKSGKSSRRSSDDSEDTSVTTTKTSTTKTKDGSKKSKIRSSSRKSTARSWRKLTRENPTFILSQPDPKKGYARFPDRGVPPKLFTFGTEPAYAYMHAFRENNRSRKDFYTGDGTTVAAIFNEAPPHGVFYPNGELAIEISKGEKGPKLIVYSMSKLNERGEWIDSRPMAIFDSKGNGVVYDIDGRIRMNYDQVEGAIYGKKNGEPLVHWHWKGSSLVVQRRSDLETVPEDPNDDIDSENLDPLRAGKASSKSSVKSKGKKGQRKRNKNKEVEPPKKTKSKTEHRRERTLPPFTNVDYSPVYDVRPIVMKITDFIGLRVVDQKHIHLDFHCRHIHYRFYIGFTVRTDLLERIDKVIVSRSPETLVPCYFEILPNRSESLKHLNRRMVQIRQDARTKRMVQNAKRARTFGYHVWFKRRRAA